MISDNSIVFLDTECVLCNYFAHFIVRKNHRRTIQLASLSGTTAGKWRLSAGNHKVDTVIYLKNGIFYYKSNAVIEILSDINLLFKCAKIFYIIPQKLRNYLYDFIARNRYKIWKGKKNCLLLDAQKKKFFLD
ncbi:MAG: DUF393 domain-containing protein [Flavobacteriales bacterium]|nr:DUF393 domain-containing protein [Flavobacteriales bacterium]